MTDLLPPNATALERALDGAAARAALVPAPLRELWSADDCPVGLLPWLAWALNVDYWRADWSPERRRENVKQSVSWHRSKATLGALQDALLRAGVRSVVSENPGGARHTIRITTYSLLGEAVPSNAEVRAVIERAKRLSVHYAATFVHSFSRLELGVRGALVPVRVARTLRGDFRS